MTGNAWLGLGLGVVIGLVYALWQRRAMGAGPKPEDAGKAFGGAILRLAAMLAVIWIAVRFTPAHRMWLVGGVMGAYGILFAAMMLKVMRNNK